MPQLPLFSASYGRELSPSQSLVRDWTSGDGVVVAGAGTGKTEALIQRVLKLLVEGDGSGSPLELEQILALTFTDKGAGEMRERVYAGIVRFMRSLPKNHSSRRRLERMRAEFGERHRVLTFDAFNRRILNQFGSPWSDEIALLDEAGRMEQRRAITRQFWNRAETFSDAEKRGLWELLAFFASRRAALNALEEMADAHDEAVLQGISCEPSVSELRANLQRLCADHNSRATRKHERRLKSLWSAVEFAVERAAPPDELRALLLDQELIAKGGKSGVVTQKGWAAAFQKRWSPELLNGANLLEAALVAWHLAAKSGPEILEVGESLELDMASRRAVAQLARHALWWSGARRAWCEENGVADFSDVARAALERAQEFAVSARLKKEFRAVLVDEFQDTNPLQWALVEALREREKGNVLLVGDEKQAIFRFRGGDITVFERARRELLGANLPMELRESHRSNAELVAWTNSVFRAVLPSSEERESFEAPFLDLEATRPANSPSLWQIQPREWQTDAENERDANAFWGADLKRERAARALARFLRELCDDAKIQGDAQILGDKNADLRHPEFADVAAGIARGEPTIGVLFATNLAKSVFEEALRAAGVPFVAVRGRGFFSCEPVEWTIHLLRVLLDAHDRFAFVGLARSPLGALSDVALLEWHLSAPENEEFAPSRPTDQLAWRVLNERLTMWRDWARVQPFSSVLERILDASELAFYEAGLPDAQIRAQNWRKLLDIVREREAARAGGLRALADYLGTLRDEAEDEADAPLPAEGAIQLMTVHAAKGLGFPFVILAQPDAAPLFKGERLQKAQCDGEFVYAFKGTEAQLCDEEESQSKEAKARKEASRPLAWRLATAREREEDEAQWLRLFYVACTRSREKLLFIASEKGENNPLCWQNLPGAHFETLRSLQPMRRDWDSVEVASSEGIPSAALIQNAPRELQRATPRERTLGALYGEKSSDLSRTDARRWLAKRLKSLGADASQLREEVPFSLQEKEFRLLGAWEWLAPLNENKLLLAATGDENSAPRRAAIMRCAAQEMKLEIGETWALWKSGNEVEARKLGS